MSAICIAKLWNTALFVPGLYDKTSASWYCFTSDVMYKWYKRLVCTHLDSLGKILQSKLVEHKKFGLIFFPGLINLRWSRAIMALKCDRRWLPVFGCTYEAIICKIWFTLGLFANYFSLKSGSLSLKSHINVL